MTDGLSASRMSLVAERSRNNATITQTELEIADAETKLGILRNRKKHLEERNEQLAEGIEALREVERNGNPEA